MKNLVIDSGISVKWFVAEDDSPAALQILKEYQSEKTSFLAPTLIYAEFGNIIWKKLVFQGLDSDDANFAIQIFKNISFVLSRLRFCLILHFRLPSSINAHFTTRFIWL